MVLPYGDRNPTRRTPFVTVALIVANVAVFLLVNAQLQGCELMQAVYRYAAVPVEVLQFRPVEAQAIPDPMFAECVGPVVGEKSIALSIVSSMFLHGGVLHLGFNMLFLWVFGNNVEDRLGHLRYAGYYLLGGVVALYGFALLNPDGTMPVLGASGAVAAVLGGYLILYPRAIVHAYVPFPLYVVAPIVPRARITSFWVLFAIMDLPSWLVLTIWFGSQVTGVSETAEAGVAYEAHIAGFLAGIVITLVLGGRPGSARRRATQAY